MMNTNLCRILCCLLLFCSGGIQTVNASSENVEEIVSEASDLLVAKQADAAWELLKDLGDHNYTELYTHRAFILASGWLSSGFDRCGAILNMEKAVELGNVIPGFYFLDNLYEGSWKAVASLEGSRSALFWKGYDLSRMDSSSNYLAKTDATRPLRDSAKYLYHSAMLGFEPAIVEVARMEKRYPDIFVREKYIDEIQKTKPLHIYCPPRTYE